jgi:hypothetical protein
MKSIVRCSVFLLLACSAALSQAPAASGFRALHVDAGKVTGEIHSFQGMNGMPAPIMAGLPGLAQQFKELRVSMVRTHDVMGPIDIDAKFEFTNKNLADLIPDPVQRAGVVKAGNASIIFPDENADPEKPASYNFGPTDKMLAAVHASGAEVYYRIGRSWGANTNPPADFDKYARVVKHIAMHYNQGWDNGFHYNVRYWEFWNEPGDVFWTGTPEQFYSLYAKTALALKSVDPTLKVGGDATWNPSGDGGYRESFLDYCVAHNVPLDFYSWHFYADQSADPYENVRLAGTIRGILDAHRFPKAESILSEWNLSSDCFSEKGRAELESMHNAAFIGAALSYFQDAPLDYAMYYRGDAAPWVGLFDRQGRYFKTAYTFKAMGKMLDTPMRLAVEGTDTLGFAALAGRSADGKTVQLFISNYAISPEFMHKHLSDRTNVVYRDNSGYNLTVNNLPWGNKAFSLKRYRISSTQNLQLVEEKSESGGSLKLSNSFPTDTIDLIVLEQK